MVTYILLIGRRPWLMLTCNSAEIRLVKFSFTFCCYFRKKWEFSVKLEKENASFPTEKWHKYYWTANIWSHLSLFWTGKKIKIIPEGATLMLVGKWRGWHGRSFQWLKSFHFHIAFPQIEHLSLFSFCIWLSSVQNLKKKMLEFHFPSDQCQVKVLKPSQLFSKLPSKATIEKRTIISHSRIWVIILLLRKVWKKSVLSRSIYMITRKFGEIKFSGVARADAVGNNFHINQRWTEGCLFAFLAL